MSRSIKMNARFLGSTEFVSFSDGADREKATGKILATETINLVQENQRIRTTQSFSIEGVFQGVMLIVERRIS